MPKTIRILRDGKVARVIELNEKQTQCLESKAKSLLLSGAFRSGKTLAALVKIITQHCRIPNNRGLIGRLTYKELSDTIQKDFFELLPPEWIAKYSENDGQLILDNGTEILFRHLDSVSEAEIRGMSLGFAFISQIEEISEAVYLALLSRLSLQHVPMRQLIMDCNPLLFWGYKYFKQEISPDRELIEFSMYDNQKHLPEDYFTDMLRRPASWKRQFVDGIWDESLLSDRSVIPVEYIQQQKRFIKPPLRITPEGVKVYEEMMPGHTYQIGVDASEGIGRDYSAFSCMNCDTHEQALFWRGQVPPDRITEIVLPFARAYNEALIIPEINGIGLAFLTTLKQKYDNIYHRQAYDKAYDDVRDSLGWRTTFSTKALLVDVFLKLLREGMIKIRSQECIDEMATFVYTEESRKSGMGAETGFHDDAIIATMLSCLDMDKNRRVSFHEQELSHLPREAVET